MKTTYQNNIDLVAKITPRYSYDGSELCEWQKQARERLSLLMGLDKFTKVAPELEIEFEEKIDGATEIRFTYQSEEGYRVPCHLWLPDGVENPPVMICLQGHSTGMHISLGRPKFENDAVTISGGDRDFCVRSIKEGFAAISVEMRAFGEMNEGGRGPRCLNPAMNSLMLGRTMLAERVWDLQRLVDVLEESFSDKVDVKTICCMGNSGGGTATVYLAALEDRIILAMPSCAMCTFKDSIGAMPHCACNYVPSLPLNFDMGDLMAMAYPKYFVQVSGKEDDIFPLFGAKEVFEKGKAAYKTKGLEDKCVMVEGNGGHRFYADDAWPFVHKFIGK